MSLKFHNLMAQIQLTKIIFDQEKNHRIVNKNKAKKIKSYAITRSNREKTNIAIAILEKSTIG